MEIKPVGSVLTVGRDGFLIPKASKSNIQSEWLPAVEAAKEAVLRRLGESAKSIYLRGSVAKGKAISDVSDLDLIALVSEIEKIIPVPEWQPEVQREVRSRFPFVAKVECALYSYEATITGRQPYYVGFYLTVEGVPLFGEDVSRYFSRYRPDAVLAESFHRHIARDLKHAEREIRSRTDSGVLKICVWIMRRLLRTGFALVMPEEQVFTRDLPVCLERFSKHYPGQAPEMRQALEWAVNPISDRERLTLFLDDFGVWLTREFERRYPHAPRP